MNHRAVSMLWQEPGIAARSRTAVCLHGHTLHSQECLSFLPRYLHHVPGISQMVTHYQRRRHVDFARTWWTPPLTPASAHDLERRQIAALGLRPMVSLTDHDDIEAPLALAVTADAAETPISVEWTVPYQRSIFHLGIHNLPRGEARTGCDACRLYRRAPRRGAAGDPRRPVAPARHAHRAQPSLLAGRRRYGGRSSLGAGRAFCGRAYPGFTPSN